ncbi:MAG: hypothetical protein ACOCZR_04740 [Halanaerobiales bacterium]
MHIWTVLKESWFSFRRNILKFIMFSIIWFTAASFLFFTTYRSFFSGEYYLSIFPLLFSGPLLLIGLKVAKECDFSFKIVFSTMRSHFGRAVLSFVFALLIYGILIFDLYFVLTRIWDQGWYLIFPVLVFYVIIFFTMYQVVFWGLLVLRPMWTFWQILRQAYRIVLGNLLFSFFWTILIIVLSGSLLFSRIGMPLFFIAFSSLMIVNGSEFMLKRMEREVEKKDA